MTSLEIDAAADWSACRPPEPISLVVPWQMLPACLEHIGDAPAHPIEPGYHVDRVEVEGFGRGDAPDSYRWARITVTFAPIKT